MAINGIGENMKENEAIEWIKELKLSEEIREFYYAENFIKACDVALPALEKQIPKKPMISYDERVKENWCSCSVCVFGFGWKRTIHYKYCPNCGQKIDWSDELNV